MCCSSRHHGCRHFRSQTHHAERGYNAVQFQGAVNAWVRSRRYEAALSLSAMQRAQMTCWEGGPQKRVPSWQLQQIHLGRPLMIVALRHAGKAFARPVACS